VNPGSFTKYMERMFEETTVQENDAKKKAADFLNGLRKHLDERLPIQRVEQWICGKGKAAKEERFVEELVLKEIHAYLQARDLRSFGGQRR
jgi:predicted transglutaminase-like protease